MICFSGITYHQIAKLEKFILEYVWLFSRRGYITLPPKEMGDGDAYQFKEFYIIENYKDVSKHIYIYTFLLVLQR